MFRVFGILFFLSNSLISLSQNTFEFEFQNASKRDSVRANWKLENYLWSYAKNNLQTSGKRNLDFESIDNWYGLGKYVAISNDGKYFAYTMEMENRLDLSKYDYDSLVVQSTSFSNRWAFARAKPGFFTEDNRQYVFQQKDTLWFLWLRENKLEYMPNVHTYKIPVNAKKEWIVYQLVKDKCAILKNLITGKEKRFCHISTVEIDEEGRWLACRMNSKELDRGTYDLLFYNMETKAEKHYVFVEDYVVSKSGKVLLLKSKERTDAGIIHKLRYVNFSKLTEKTIWAKAGRMHVDNCKLDDSGGQILFVVTDSSNMGMTEAQIWFYEDGMDNAVVKVSNELIGVGDEFQVLGKGAFTDNGKYIQLSLVRNAKPASKYFNSVKLEVWSYKDLFHGASKLSQSRQTDVRKAIFSIDSSKIVFQESDGKELIMLQGDFAVVKEAGARVFGDRFWEKGYSNDIYWLVSLSDGSFHSIPKKGKGRHDIDMWFSPDGKYLVYFGAEEGCHYFSYDLHSKVVKKISTTIPDYELGLDNFSYFLSESKPQIPFGLAAWFQDDGGLLVYSNYDIWQLDIKGERSPINITNGYGQINNIKFTVLGGHRYYGDVPIVDKKSLLVLSSFNTENKCNGFFSKSLSTKGNPRQLFVDTCFFYLIRGCHDPNLSNKGINPLKARDSEVWIVQRQSIKDAPNYYLTKNFELFSKLTNVQPQLGFNWVSQELHTYQHLDGKHGQGILFKPENFDSTRKYPVIIIFYGAFSNNYHQFPTPKYNRSVITPGESPIWLLNNGYLVFTPDIYVAPRRYGPAAYNVIEGAAEYLKQLPFVDSSKLGCGSHSWSAKLGAYIFTHSHSFSAMAISEGYLYANMINVAFSTNEKGDSHLENVEKQFYFGNFWENKDSWLDQVTVINVDKATSPLLLLCNNNSNREYQDQTVQLYTALRRLEKRVWWLKYSRGGHTLTDMDEMKDFTIRYLQYFDHYLKGAPAPRWMTQMLNTPTREGLVPYELDPAGSCSLANENSCPVCIKWNRLYENDCKMFEKPINEWDTK